MPKTIEIFVKLQPKPKELIHIHDKSLWDKSRFGTPDWLIVRRPQSEKPVAANPDESKANKIEPDIDPDTDPDPGFLPPAMSVALREPATLAENLDLRSKITISRRKVA